MPPTVTKLPSRSLEIGERAVRPRLKLGPNALQRMLGETKSPSVSFSSRRSSRSSKSVVASGGVLRLDRTAVLAEGAVEDGRLPGEPVCGDALDRGPSRSRRGQYR